MMSERSVESGRVPGSVLALDVGTQTIGVAVSDPLGLVARPVLTVARKGLKQDIPALAGLVAAHGARRVVVGLPLELDGTEARSARLARQVGEAVRAETGLPVVYVDERYSSVEAERRLIAQGMSRARRKQVIDQEAAAIVLQAWLDHGVDVEEPAAPPGADG